eukprot:676245-Prorocentrum_minimum.AAC.3
MRRVGGCGIFLVRDCDWSVGERLHSASAPSEKVPGWHGEHVSACISELNVPDAHATHLLIANRTGGARAYSRHRPIRHRKRQTGGARAYSRHRPIRHRQRGYILITDQSDTGHAPPRGHPPVVPKDVEAARALHLRNKAEGGRRGVREGGKGWPRGGI